MKRRGFLGALLAAPLALVGRKVLPKRWNFPPMPHGAPGYSVPSTDASYQFTSDENHHRRDLCWTTGMPGLKRGDTFTIEGVYR